MRESTLPHGKSVQCGGQTTRYNQARTIIVVTNENFRSVLIKFAPFYSHTKSDIAHFYILGCKNLPGFILITTFNSSPFRQDQTKFHAYLFSVPAIDPLLTFRVVFPACRNPDVAIRVCKGKRLPTVFSGVWIWSGVKCNGNN